MKNHNYYVYIMASNSGTLYTGITNDLRRRVYEHKSNLTTGFSKKYKCNKLVYWEQFSQVEEAISREKFIKGKKRSFKEELIRLKNPGWRDIAADWEESFG